MEANSGFKWMKSCRLCLDDDDIMLSIFEEEGVQRQISQKLGTCFPFSVYESDPLPKMICHKCLYNLETTFEFRTKCLEILKTMYEKLLKMKHIPSVYEYLQTFITGKAPVQVEHSSSTKTVPVVKPVQATQPVQVTPPTSRPSFNERNSENVFQEVFLEEASCDGFFSEQCIDENELGQETADPIETMQPSKFRQRHAPIENKRKNSVNIRKGETMDITTVPSVQKDPNRDSVIASANKKSYKAKKVSHQVLNKQESILNNQESKLKNQEEILCNRERESTLNNQGSTLKHSESTLKEQETSLRNQNNTNTFQLQESTLKDGVTRLKTSETTFKSSEVKFKGPEIRVRSQESLLKNPVTAVKTQTPIIKPIIKPIMINNDISLPLNIQEKETVAIVKPTHESTVGLKTEQRLESTPIPSYREDMDDGSDASIEVTKSFKCRGCFKYYKTMGSLKKHKRYACTGKAQEKKPVKTSKTPYFSCKYCRSNYTDLEELYRHQKVHIDILVGLKEQELWPCDVCDQKCSTKYMLSIHMRLHQSRKPGPLSRTKRLKIVSDEVNVGNASTAAEHSELPTPIVSEEVQKTQNLSEMTPVKKAPLLPQPPQPPQPVALASENESSWLRKCTCKYCGAVSQDSSALWEHMIEQHSSPNTSSLRCNVCSHTCLSQTGLTLHMKVHSKKKEAKKPAPSVNLLGFLGNTSTTQITNEDLKKKSPTGTNVTFKSLDVKYKSPCTFCGQVFLDYLLLLEHEKTHKDKVVSSSPIQTDTSLPCSSDPSKFVCSTCKRVFSSRGGLTRHEKKHIVRYLPFSCKVCRKRYLTEGNLRLHMTLHSEIMNDPLPKSYRCSTCNTIFSDMDSFKMHHCVLSALKICGFCGLEFTEEELGKHICSDREVVNNGEIEPVDVNEPKSKEYINSEYTCTECSRKYKTHKAFLLHSLSHTYNQIDLPEGCIGFKCNVCLKVFPTDQDAASHSKVHLARSFVCPFCSQHFGSHKTLSRHVNIIHPENN